MKIFQTLFRRFAIGQTPPPNAQPLPHHPSKGLRVEKGDTFAITDMRISVHDLNEPKSGVDDPFHARIPEAARDFSCGASFGLRRKLEPRRVKVDENVVIIDHDERTFHVLLKRLVDKPFASAYQVAEKVLDLLAVESFSGSELKDPLREYSTWSRIDGKSILTLVTSARLGVRMRAKAEVRDPSGQRRVREPPPPTRWHPSFAYFRRSQSTDNLHDAYRYLFLALEALLSEVYPWRAGVGERRWMKGALRYVMEGYGLSLSGYVGGEGGNPYRRFWKEQYQARRCALFHSKVHENPTVPGELATRDELAEATERLGRLYVLLAQKITGVRFAGGTLSTAAFERMMGAFDDCDLYVSPDEEFDEGSAKRESTKLISRVNGHAELYHQSARWRAADLPSRHIRRIGSVAEREGTVEERAYSKVQLTLQEVDVLEVIMQTELANADHLRRWFL